MVLILILIYLFFAEILILHTLFKKRENYIDEVLTIGDIIFAMILGPVIAPLLLLDLLFNIPIKKI